MFNLKKVELLERQLHNAEVTCIRLRKNLEIYESKEPKKRFAIFYDGKEVASVFALHVRVVDNNFKFYSINEFGVDKTVAEYNTTNYAYKEIEL